MRAPRFEAGLGADSSEIPNGGFVLLIRRHQVLTYFLLAFAISWGGILAVVLVAGVPKSSAELIALFVPVYVAMLLGPSVSSLALTLALEGRAGLGALLGIFGRWFVAPRDYLLALAAPAVALVVLGILSAMSPIYTPTVFTAAGGLPLLATGIVIGLGAGFLEELGWTGFAARRLLSTRGLIATAVLIGVPHGLWHLLVGYFWGDGASFGLWFIPYFIVAWIVTLTALRLLIVWLYQRTQSGLIAALTHAGYTCSLMVLWPVGTSPVQTMVWTTVFAAALLGAVLALTLLFPNKEARVVES